MVQKVQPKHPVIDWSHPLAKGLVTVATSFNGVKYLYDPVTKQSGYTLQTGGGGVTDPKLIPSKHGIALSNRPDNQYFWKHSSVHPGGQSKATLFARYRANSYPSNGASPFGSGESNTSPSTRFMLKLYSNQMQIALVQESGSLIAANWNTTAPIEKWTDVAGTFSGPDQRLTFYVDGIVRAGPTPLASANAIEGSPVHNYKILNGTSGDFTREFDGDIAIAMAWHGRELTDSEVAAISENPWQVFKSRTLFAHTEKYFPPAIEAQAPAGNTLTITLVDAAGNPQTNLTGISWAWFDESTVNSASTPTATGTGATTDGSGVFSVDITGTTLTSGQVGMLALMDSTGYIYALYRITLT